jgi:hypothetical protein
MALGDGHATTSGLQCAAAGPAKETVILKLGGSSITDKGQCVCVMGCVVCVCRALDRSIHSSIQQSIKGSAVYTSYTSYTISFADIGSVH